MLALVFAAALTASGCGGSTQSASQAPALRDPKPAPSSDLLANAEGGAAATPATTRHVHAGRRVTRHAVKMPHAGSKAGTRKAAAPVQPKKSTGPARHKPAAKTPVKGGAPGAPKTVIHTQVSPADAARIEAVKNVIRALAHSVSTGDSSACTRLMTQHYVESITGLHGQAAVAKCRLDMSKSHGNVVVSRIDGVRLSGSSALIQFATSANGTDGGTQILKLVDSGGSWLIDEALRAAGR